MQVVGPALMYVRSALRKWTTDQAVGSKPAGPPASDKVVHHAKEAGSQEKADGVVAIPLPKFDDSAGVDGIGLEGILAAISI